MPRESLDRIRQQYPQYKDLSDHDLAGRIIMKYPQYRDLLGDVAITPGPRSPVEAQITGQIDDRTMLGAHQLTWAQKLVRQSAAPTLMGVAGAAIGTVAAPFTLGIVNPVTGAMAASGLGELANQTVLKEWTGSEWSPFALGLSTAAPAAGPAIRMVGKNLPGATQGMQDVAQRALGLRGEKLREIHGASREVAEFLWSRVKDMNEAPVVLSRFGQTVAKHSKELGMSEFAGAGMKRMVQRGAKLSAYADEAGVVTFERARTNMSHLGAQVRALEKKGGQAHGLAKDLYKSLVDDIEEAVLTAPVHQKQAYRLAIEATKRQHLSGWIKDAFQKSIQTRVGAPQLDFDGIITKLERNRDLLEKLIPPRATTNAFGQKVVENEVDDIIKAIREVSHIPVAAKAAGDSVRGIVAPERIVMGGAIAGGAKLMGMDATGSIATGVGGIVAVEVLSRMLGSPAGRAAIRGLSKVSGSLDQLFLTLGQMGKSAMELSREPQQ